MIRIQRLPSDSLEIVDLAHGDFPEDFADGGFYWIDLQNPTPEEEIALFTGKLKIHPLTLDDITKPRREPSQGAHFPKVEEFPDYLFIIVNPLLSLLDDGSAEPDPKAKPWNRTHRQLSAVVFLNVLVTHHYDPLSSVDALREWLARHPRTMERGPDYMLHLILDAMVDEYAPLIDRIAEHLDRLETRVYRDPADTLMRRMIRMKRLIVSLRKTLILEREVLARLSRGEFEFVDEREQVYYRNVFDHLVRYTELIEGGREMVGDLMQSYHSATSNRMNRIMKSLAIISTIILPMNLVAGIYGMNFESMPELKWDFGYPLALLIMALTGGLSIFLFRRQRWL